MDPNRIRRLALASTSVLCGGILMLLLATNGHLRLDAPSSDVVATSSGTTPGSTPGTAVASTATTVDLTKAGDCQPDSELHSYPADPGKTSPDNMGVPVQDPSNLDGVMLQLLVRTCHDPLLLSQQLYAFRIPGGPTSGDAINQLAAAMAFDGNLRVYWWRMLYNALMDSGTKREVVQRRAGECYWTFAAHLKDGVWISYQTHVCLTEDEWYLHVVLPNGVEVWDKLICGFQASSFTPLPGVPTTPQKPPPGTIPTIPGTTATTRIVTTTTTAFVKCGPNDPAWHRSPVSGQWICGNDANPVVTQPVQSTSTSTTRAPSPATTIIGNLTTLPAQTTVPSGDPCRINPAVC